MKWYIMALRNYAVFTGRARRMEYWMFAFISFIISILLMLLDFGMGLTPEGSTLGLLNCLYSFAVLVPGLAVTVRRFHDIGKSGWVYARFLIGSVLICIAGFGYMVYCMMKDGGFEAIMNDEIDPTKFVGSFIIILLVIAVVMLILAIWMLVYLFRDSQPGTNKWGPNPKEVGMPPAEQL